jgi:hypothetical protein
VHDCALYLGNKKDSLTKRCPFSKHIPVIPKYIIVTSNWLLFSERGNLDNLKKELEVDDHKITLEELYRPVTKPYD